jgi:hypothetical protein
VERLFNYLQSENGSFPQGFNIILIAFFVILVILFTHLILRWLRVYLREKKKTEKPVKPDIKLKKIPTPKYKLMIGGTYLVFERTEREEGEGFKIFKDILRTGSPGLVVSRIYPEKILSRYDLGELPVIWLSRSKNENAIQPTNLGAVVEEIKEFASKNTDSIIMFDGLEYLTVHNEFDRVLKLLHSLEDEIALHKARLLISLNPSTLSNKKVALISKEMKVLNRNKEGNQKNQKDQKSQKQLKKGNK